VPWGMHRPLGSEFNPIIVTTLEMCPAKDVQALHQGSNQWIVFVRGFYYLHAASPDHVIDLM